MWCTAPSCKIELQCGRESSSRMNAKSFTDQEDAPSIPGRQWIRRPLIWPYRRTISGPFNAPWFGIPFLCASAWLKDSREMTLLVWDNTDIIPKWYTRILFLWTWLSYALTAHEGCIRTARLRPILVSFILTSACSSTAWICKALKKQPAIKF